MPLTRSNRSVSKHPIFKAYRSMQAVKRKLAGPSWSQFNAYELDQIKKAKSFVRVNRLATNFSQKNFTKRHLGDATAATRNGNQLYAANLCDNIVQGDNVNDRQRQVIFVKGVTISLYLRNVDETTPVNMRWCVLMAKGAGPVTVNDNFYRGAGVQRYVNFDDVSNGLHHMTYPINRDKFKVLAEGKYSLAPSRTPVSTVSYYSGSQPSHMQLQRYIPVGEKIEFDGTSAGAGLQTLWFCYWATGPAYNLLAPKVAQITSALHTLVHFVDPQ